MDKAIYSADDLNILKRENQSLRSELQRLQNDLDDALDIKNGNEWNATPKKKKSLDEKLDSISVKMEELSKAQRVIKDERGLPIGFEPFNKKAMPKAMEEYTNQQNASLKLELQKQKELNNSLWEITEEWYSIANHELEQSLKYFGSESGAYRNVKRSIDKYESLIKKHKEQ